MPNSRNHVTQHESDGIKHSTLYGEIFFLPACAIMPMLLSALSFSYLTSASTSFPCGDSLKASQICATLARLSSSCPGTTASTFT